MSKFVGTSALFAVLSLMASACSEPSPEVQTGCPQAPARDVTVIVPGQMSSDDVDLLGRALDAGLANSTAINTSVRFADGASGERFPRCGGFINDARLQDARTRLDVAVTPLIQAYRQHLSATSAQTVHVDMVMAVEHASRFVPGDVPKAVVIYAPLQRNLETDIQVAIRDSRYPSLGHLSASPRDSTLSVVGRENRLRGVDVYLVSPATETWAGDLGVRYRLAATNFWVCWLQAQGATVRYTGTSVEMALQMAIDGGDVASAACESDPTQSKPEMLTVAAIPQSLENCDVQLAATSGGRTSRTTGPIEVGITWEGGASTDLDLHARADADSPELYFAYTEVPGGVFNKRAAATGETGARGFEWVRFENVDVRNVRIAVNLYEVLGAERLAQGPRGQLRVAFDGRCYVRDFSLRARTGDRGGGRDDPNRGARPEWTEDLGVANLVLLPS